jgi:hypothetical protein
LKSDDSLLGERYWLLRDGVAGVDTSVDIVDRDAPRCSIEDGPQVGLRAAIIGQVARVDIDRDHSP